MRCPDRVRVLVLAHRGMPTPTRSENSRAAVAAALDAGADGVEVDVRITSDGVLALSHDPDLRRVAGSPLAVGAGTWRCLRETAEERGVELARAEDVLVLAGGRRVVLEVKTPPPGPDAAARASVAVAAMLRTLRRDGLPMDVTVSSFSASVADHLRRLVTPAAGVRTALLGRPLARPHSLLRQALLAGHDEVHPHVTSLLAAPEAVATAHAVGLSVCAWTVNRRRDVRRLARLGCDALITDVPADARVAADQAVRRSPVS